MVIKTAPSVVEYVPAAQRVQVRLDCAAVDPEYVPAGQAVQVAELIAPVDPEYVPAGQFVH